MRQPARGGGGGGLVSSLSTHTGDWGLVLAMPLVLCLNKASLLLEKILWSLTLTIF